MSDNIEPVAGQENTQGSENGKLENNPIPGLPDGPCDVCGKDTHSTQGHGIRGGARIGGGRKAGGMNYTTKERMAIKKAVEDRIHKNADKLLNAALNKALGESYLMHKFTVGSGNKQRTEVEIVTDPQTIMEYLNDELDVADDEYYYISTKPVDMVAVKDLYDRAFGRAPQEVKNSGEQKLIIETRRHKG